MVWKVARKNAALSSIAPLAAVLRVDDAARSNWCPIKMPTMSPIQL
jgi:hypothetical protein